MTSPDMVLLLSLAGTLDFDPSVDFVTTDDGTQVKFEPPVGVELPPRGFDSGNLGLVVTPETNTEVKVAVSPDSSRLQLLEPFAGWDGADYLDMPVLMKAAGKCTTDQISAAGAWLRCRGHLENISDNLFLGVVNAYTGAVGEGRDPLDEQTRPFPQIARRLRDAGVPWCVVGGENYGEGSSREHAAMEPRYLGAVVIFARSFARIHETNLKKQGLLALKFADPDTYELIGVDDRISVIGLSTLAPGDPITCYLAQPNGNRLDFECTHTFSADQIEWFRAGSALNVMARRVTGARP